MWIGTDVKATLINFSTTYKSHVRAYTQALHRNKSQIVWSVSVSIQGRQAEETDCVVLWEKLLVTVAT